MKDTTQATIFRVLQLITFLKKGHNRRNTLAAKLNVSEKTISRYFKALTEIGYTIKEDNKNRFYLEEPDASQIAHHFEPLEVEVLRQLLIGLPDTQPLKQALLHKVTLQSNLIPLAETLTNTAISKIMGQLNEAILKKQVILKGYTSADGTVKDLFVEPLILTDSYQFMVYDVDRKKIITPVLDRIGSVIILDTPQTYKGDADQQDIFGYADMDVQIIHLELNHLAYKIMLREYPLSKSFIHCVADNKYFFKGPVLSYIGVGRFCLSLIGQLKVIENEGFRNFLNEKRENNQF